MLIPRFPGSSGVLVWVSNEKGGPHKLGFSKRCGAAQANSWRGVKTAHTAPGVHPDWRRQSVSPMVENATTASAGEDGSRESWRGEMQRLPRLQGALSWWVNRDTASWADEIYPEQLMIGTVVTQQCVEDRHHRRVPPLRGPGSVFRCEASGSPIDIGATLPELEAWSIHNVTLGKVLPTFAHADKEC